MAMRSEYLYDLSQSLPSDDAGAPVQKSSRTHTWHASYAVLAVLTTQLLLSGCDNKTATEQAAPDADPAVQMAPEEAPAPSAGYPADPAMSAPAVTEPGMTEPLPEEPGAAPAPDATQP